jgi:hypothetical protein
MREPSACIAAMRKALVTDSAGKVGEGAKLVNESGVVVHATTVALSVTGSVTLAAVALLVALLLPGCGRPSDGLSEKQAVEIAASALMGKPGFDRNVPVSVTRLADRYTVKFQFPVPGGRRGETYHSFVAVDVRSGEVLELGVEQN